MPILATAEQHFEEDLARATSLVDHAEPLTEGVVRDDVMRAAWMMAVGALDAFFCDAYADLVARTLQAKQLEPSISIPDRLMNLKVPVVAVIRHQKSDNWRWRMAARELIEDETVLSFDKIRGLFNHFFRDRHKLFTEDSIEPWILHRQAKQRLFGISATDYRKLGRAAKNTTRKTARDCLEERFSTIFQRRHDCIHNCDRPKVAINTKHVISVSYMRKVLYDVRFLVHRCIEALRAEYPVYLQDLGASIATRNRLC